MTIDTGATPSDNLCDVPSRQDLGYSNSGDGNEQESLERAQFLDNIDWISTHVPACVRHHLSEEVEFWNKQQTSTQEKLNSQQQRQCCETSDEDEANMLVNFDGDNDDQCSAISDISMEQLERENDDDDDDETLSQDKSPSFTSQDQEIVHDESEGERRQEEKKTSSHPAMFLLTKAFRRSKDVLTLFVSGKTHNNSNPSNGDRSKRSNNPDSKSSSLRNDTNNNQNVLPLRETVRKEMHRKSHAMMSGLNRANNEMNAYMRKFKNSTRNMKMSTAGKDNNRNQERGHKHDPMPDNSDEQQTKFRKQAEAALNRENGTTISNRTVVTNDNDNDRPGVNLLPQNNTKRIERNKSSSDSFDHPNPETKIIPKGMMDTDGPTSSWTDESPRINIATGHHPSPQEKEHNKNSAPLSLPYASKCQCALLFVDVSGFTKLSVILDPDTLSQVMNTYFQLLVNEVTSKEGDIVKFAGDAMFAQWRVSPTMTLADCLLVAATCGAEMVKKWSDFPVDDRSSSNNNGVVTSTLNIHCGVSAGEVIGVHVGDHEHRREYFLLGDPIRHVTDACNAASLGEVAASPSAVRLLSQQCTISELRQDRDQDDPIVIAQRSMRSFKIQQHSMKRELSSYIQEYDDDHGLNYKSMNISHSSNISNVNSTTISNNWTLSCLEQYHKLISLYVHPVVVQKDLKTSNRHSQETRKITRRMSSCSSVGDVRGGRCREEAELRRVYTMFISPLISMATTNDIETDNRLFVLLNDIMNLVTRELDRFSGHLRQFIADDKGLVLIATFGLRGSCCPNMVTERALPATTAIQYALENELGVQNRIGVTIGHVYCGVVGGINRHEYAVLGPSVNLAARLMKCPQNRGILVDSKVRRMAGKSFAFNALDPVKAKGYSDLVPIFEPLTSFERRGWGREVGRNDFVGRKKEIQKLLGIARGMVYNNNWPNHHDQHQQVHAHHHSLPGQSSTKLALVSAESGMGKSTTIVQATVRMRRLKRYSRKRLFFARHRCNDGDKLVPFSIFQSIFMDVLTEFQNCSDNDDVSTNRNSISTQTSASSCTSFNTRGSTKSEKALLLGKNLNECVGFICTEIGAPLEFVEFICQNHLLGLDKDQIMKKQQEEEQQNNNGDDTNDNTDKKQTQQKKKKKVQDMDVLVDFMAKAILRCIGNTSLTVVALDDVHQMDEMSWRLVQKLYETAEGANIFLLCATRPLSRYSLAVDKQFWNDLTTNPSNRDRFVSMHLDRLEEDDIRYMISKTLSLKDENTVGDQFCRDVYLQCGGIPHFAREILNDIKRTMLLDKNGNNSHNNTFCRRKDELLFASWDEFIIARIDAFDVTVRNILNLAAVLGTSFDILIVIQVMQHFVDTTTEESDVSLHAEMIRTSLDLAVKEGVLYELYEGGDDSFGEDSLSSEELKESPARDDENMSYTFCHDIWRSSILEIMLDSRKKDMHRIIAMTLEARQEGCGGDLKDYGSRLKLFSHWKASGDVVKAASLALSIGTDFMDAGLYTQSIHLYEEALEMWRGPEQDGEMIGGFSRQVLDSACATDVECIIKLHISLGKCFANVYKADQSVVAYQNALLVFQEARAGDDIKDRSIAFPIFSGLFLAIKFGQIEQDEECTYEQDLVGRFVNETRLNGDPVHYSRALAMQGEMYGRLGNYKKAFEAHRELEKVYVVEEHSAAICKLYGSDRSGQSFSVSTMWHVQEGRTEEALRTCTHVIEELIPKMDSKNVHNSCIMLYSPIWVMKDNGLALMARETFTRLVIDPFNKHYGVGGTTFLLPVFKPILMLLDLAGNQDTNNNIERMDEYVDWAVVEDNLKFGACINNGLGNFGMCADSISAEICLLLAKKSEEGDIKKSLVRNGVAVAHASAEHARSKRMIIANLRATLVLKELEELMASLEERF